MVQFKNVSKQYNSEVTAVNNVSFTIDAGEFMFLIGPSGSGKTTIIKMLIRDESPSDGKIFFDDTDITRISRKRIYRLRREIGVIFQDYKLVPEKTAYENVAFAMEAAGKTDKEIKETVPYVLDIVGLEHKIQSFPKELSGGEQQRVAIARAIANNPKILIADEPTGNLDPASSWDIVQVLTKINSWGTTVIMSTHGTEIVNSLNKRVVQMHNGEIIRDDNKGQYEMTSNFESSVLIANDNKDRPKRFSLKRKKDEKSENKEKNQSIQETKKDSNEKTEMVDLHITLGHKGIKIPVKKMIDQPEADESKNRNKKDIKKKDTKKPKTKKDKKTKEKTWVDELSVDDDLKERIKNMKFNSFESFIEEGLEKLEEEKDITDEAFESLAHAIEELYIQKI